MKISNIITETAVRNNAKRMNENFVVPYNKYLKSIAPTIKKINEAQLTADQINQIFSAAEQGATAAGGNRTFIGKGKDAVQNILNKLLPPEKKAEFEKSLPPVDAGPVPGFEEEAKAAIEQVEDPKAKKSLMDLIKQGIKNPVTQTLLMTAITGIAGVVAAPAIASLGLGGIAASTAIGAVVGGLTGVVRSKLAGEDWSAAGKAGLKGAGMGAAAGAIGGTVATLGQQALQAYQDSRQQPAPELGAGGGTYTTTAGDQLGYIAQANGTTVEALKAANPWVDFSKPLQPGMQLDLPPAGQPGQGSVWATDPQAKAEWDRAAFKSQGAALAASGNSTNADGTASDAMKRFMNADAEQMAAYNRLPGQQAGVSLAGITADQIVNNPVYQQVYDREIAKWGGNAGAMAIQNAQRIATLAAKQSIAAGVQESTVEQSSSSEERDIINSRLPIRSIERKLQEAGLEKEIRAFLRWASDNGCAYVEDCIELGNENKSHLGPLESFGLYRLKKLSGQNVSEMTDDERKKTYNYVYQIMVKQAPEFMYRADNEAVKKAIIKAMSFGNHIAPHDMASYAYGMLKSNSIDEQALSEESGSNTATLDAVFNEHDFYRLERIWPALEAGDKKEALRQINHYLNKGKNRAWWGDLQAIDINIDPADVENSLVTWSKPVNQSGGEIPGQLEESYIDQEQTARMWMLRESLGRSRGSVVLTESGVNVVLEGVMDWLKTKGRNLTTKITADKLNSAWKKAGSPTDSAEIAKILTGAGVSQDVVDSVYQQLKILAYPQLQG